MIVTVTERAIKEIKQIIQNDQLNQDKVALRIRVTGGGCSGFQNKLDLDEEYDPEKDHIDEVDGIKVAIDKRSALYLTGATVDFHEDLNKRGFVVDNPSATSRCGCGSSFSM
jgi:iron-sulfur cluster assembly accessory protein